MHGGHLRLREVTRGEIVLVAEWGPADGAFACRCFLSVRYLIRRVASDLPEIFSSSVSFSGGLVHQ